MPSHHLFNAIFWVGLICGIPAAIDAQTMPAGAAPQQMLPNGVPTTYPSTDPSSTAYPSTAMSGPAPVTLPSYNSVAPTLMAQVPDGAVGVPVMPGEVAASDYRNLDIAAAPQSLDPNPYFEHLLESNEAWSWQILPSGSMFKSYLAGNQESRFASQWVHDRDLGWLWNVALGGRAGLVRFGTENDFWPQGWQWDIEGAAFPRLDQSHDVVSNDYRFGMPLTTRQGPWEAKFGYYHLSSHLADEFMVKNPGFPRINYVRESLILAVALYLNPSLRLYSEAGYAFHTDGGAEPWELQFGADFSSPEPTSLRGAPFFAINSHLRQENNFGGSMTVETGWQWRGRTGHLFRLGMQYFNGMSEQYQFYNRFEEQIGAGLWYDY